MNSAPATLLDRRAAVCAVVGAMDGLGGVLHQTQPAELGSLLADMAHAQAVLIAQMAVVIAAAESAGVVEQSQCASTPAWVADAAWHARAQAHVLAKAAGILRRPDLRPVAAAVLTTDVTPQVAVVIAEQFDKMLGSLQDGCEDEVLDQFVNAGSEFGASQVRRLREEIIAYFGRPGSFQEEQDRCRRQVHLSAGRETADGVHQYELTLDAEGRANLEAAIGPASAPVPGPDGERDPRSVGHRRGDALIEVLRRAVGVAASGTPGGVNAIVIITMDERDLANRIGAGTVLGTRAQDTLLAPDTVRRLACDAGIIPAVLGSAGQIVDLGRQHRLFDVAQKKALWFRDRHCTFPGCTAPAAWCDAHHLVHWLDGGATNLDNGALLCGQHHSVVHRDELAGSVADGKVQWDRHPDSYQRHLAQVMRT